MLINESALKNLIRKVILESPPASSSEDGYSNFWKKAKQFKTGEKDVPENKSDSAIDSNKDSQKISKESSSDDFFNAQRLKLDQRDEALRVLKENPEFKEYIELLNKYHFFATKINESIQTLESKFRKEWDDAQKSQNKKDRISLCSEIFFRALKEINYLQHKKIIYLAYFATLLIIPKPLAKFCIDLVQFNPKMMKDPVSVEQKLKFIIMADFKPYNLCVREETKMIKNYNSLIDFIRELSQSPYSGASEMQASSTLLKTSLQDFSTFRDENESLSDFRMLGDDHVAFGLNPKNKVEQEQIKSARELLDLSGPGGSKRGIIGSLELMILEKWKDEIKGPDVEDEEEMNHRKKRSR